MVKDLNLLRVKVSIHHGWVQTTSMLLFRAGELQTRAEEATCAPSRFLPGNLSGKYENAAGTLFLGFLCKLYRFL